jgi:hypothetical protein
VVASPFQSKNHLNDIPKFVVYFTTCLGCIELKLFECIRFYLSDTKERSFGIGIILITFIISSMKIFGIIPFLSFLPQMENHRILFYMLLFSISIVFLLSFFNDYFLMIAVLISHSLLVYFFSRLLIFPMDYCEKMPLLQVILSYLCWLSWSYFFRCELIFICNKGLNYKGFLCGLFFVYLRFFTQVFGIY